MQSIIAIYVKIKAQESHVIMLLSEIFFNRDIMNINMLTLMDYTYILNNQHILAQ